jgi:hypothetical protein
VHRPVTAEVAGSSPVRPDYPNWNFRPSGEFSIILMFNPDIPTEFKSLDLACELVYATPQEISRLTKNKILRIFRGQVNTFQQLLA